MAQLHGGVAMITGGSGASGIGHYYGKYGSDVLSQSNSMLVSPPDVAIEHLFPIHRRQGGGAGPMGFSTEHAVPRDGSGRLGIYRDRW